MNVIYWLHPSDELDGANIESSDNYSISCLKPASQSSDLKNAGARKCLKCLTIQYLLAGVTYTNLNIE